MTTKTRPSLQRMEDWRMRMVEQIRECRKIGYPPDGWIKQMATNMFGAWGAAVDLVADPKLQEGLWRLAFEFHRIDLTVEMIMLESEWDDIFDEEDRRNALDKLTQVGWTP